MQGWGQDPQVIRKQRGVGGGRGGEVGEEVSAICLKGLTYPRTDTWWDLHPGLMQDGS